MSQKVSQNMLSKNPLWIKKKRSSGRNHHGRITMFHRGGGHKRAYRILDFKRSLFDTDGIVKSIEYDPNRTANIALICYKGGILSYILAPKDLKIGSKICSGPKAPLNLGNALPLECIPLGSFIHNIELLPGHGGQLMRAAGTFAKVIKKTVSHVIIRLYTGKLFKIPSKCMATLGIVSSSPSCFPSSYYNRFSWKAGHSRWLNKRPVVRGVAMNPIDHPHGGGEGKSKGGRHPVTPWGKLTKGKATGFKRISTRYAKHISY